MRCEVNCLWCQHFACANQELGELFVIEEMGLVDLLMELTMWKQSLLQAHIRNVTYLFQGCCQLSM